MRHPSQSSGLRFPFEPFDFRSGGRWQPRVAGGGAFPFSPPLSPQRSPPFSPLSSIQPLPRFRWQVAAPGGGWRGFFNSALHSVLNAVLHSVLRDRFNPPPLQVAGGSSRWRVAGVPPCLIDSVICHPSSIQPSIHFGWQVAAPGGRWRRFSIQPSTQSSTQSSIQSSVIDSAICHPSSIQLSIQ